MPKADRNLSRAAHRWSGRPWVLGLLVMAAAILLTVFAGRKWTKDLAGVPTEAGPASGLVLEDDQTVFARYGGSLSCQQCHQAEYRSWKTSNHALAERQIQPEQERAAFEPVHSFRHGSEISEVRWTNGAPAIVVAGLSGKPESRGIVRVIGNEPLRQFLVPFPGGRFQALEAAYDPRSNQWFNVFGEEDRRPGEWGHWTGRGMNWNYMCASCHNTRLRRNYDEQTDTYHTTMAEISVGCEACHGPLKAHNDWQKRKSNQKDPTLMKPTRQQITDDCGSCHARRAELNGEFKPGDNFFDHFEPVLVDHTEAYYADGQVRGEEYEYGSFLGSRMHARGISCVDCHNPHSGKTILTGNLLCLRCHNGGDTNAPVINPVAHSRHRVYGFETNGQPLNVDLAGYRPDAIQEKGGECVNCHMPQTTYMQRHRRHDHGFTIPDPLLTKQFGIPNACNRCHQDKDADWALRNCEEWYGSKMERSSRERAQMLARAQHDEPETREQLLGWLKKEASSYWQAVTLGFLERWAGRPEVDEALLHGLENTNALARMAAAHALEPVSSNPMVAEALQNRLQDPVRSVRIAAAASLRATVDPASRAGRELLHYLGNSADEPGGQVQKGIYDFSRGDALSALAHLQKAVAWDPYSAPIRQELAVVLSALNRPAEAVAVLREACRLAPRDPECHYKLGLACNEMGDLTNAVEQLTEVVRLEPRHVLAWYNLGLAQNSLGGRDAALDSLAHAEVVDPEDARIPYARATILAQLGETKRATAAVRRALELNPAYPEAKQLLQTLSE